VASNAVGAMGHGTWQRMCTPEDGTLGLV
jgi:hypothetical protein